MSSFIKYWRNKLNTFLKSEGFSKIEKNIFSDFPKYVLKQDFAPFNLEVDVGQKIKYLINSLNDDAAWTEDTNILSPIVKINQYKNDEGSAKIENLLYKKDSLKIYVMTIGNKKIDLKSLTYDFLETYSSEKSLNNVIIPLFEYILSILILFQ